MYVPTAVAEGRLQVRHCRLHCRFRMLRRQHRDDPFHRHAHHVEAGLPELVIGHHDMQRVLKEYWKRTKNNQYPPKETESVSTTMAQGTSYFCYMYEHI